MDTTSYNDRKLAALLHLSCMKGSAARGQYWVSVVYQRVAMPEERVVIALVIGGVAREAWVYPIGGESRLRSPIVLQV